MMMEKEKKMKKMYSFFAIAVTVFGLVVTGLQLLGSSVIAPVIGVDPQESSWFPFVNIIVPMYLICFPILFFILKNQEVVKPEKHKLSFGRYLLCIPLMAGMVGVGAVIGLFFHLLIVLPFGVDIQHSNELSVIMMNSNPVWRVVTVGILAPIVEEMIFRKFLIDRTYRYGEWVAIFTSGVMFGLFHGNFAQCVFATLIGGLFAFIYIRTGTIWYTVGLHAILNLSTSVITMATMKPYMSLDPKLMERYQQVSMQYLTSGGNPALEKNMMLLAKQILPKMLPFTIWSGIMGQFVMVGLVLWIIFLVKKKFTLKIAPDLVKPGGMKMAWVNAGMIIFLVYCIATFILSYVSTITQYGKI